MIDAFFDCMTPEPIDYVALREKEMPLPPRTGQNGATPHILFVGPLELAKAAFFNTYCRRRARISLCVVLVGRP